jgi:hypothetical protein
MKKSFRKKLPSWLNKDMLNFVASQREKKTNEEEKFGYLKKET